MQSCKIFFCFVLLSIHCFFIARKNQRNIFSLRFDSPFREVFYKINQITDSSWMNSYFWWDAKVQLPKVKSSLFYVFLLFHFFPMAWELKCRSCAHQRENRCKTETQKFIFSKKRILHYARFMFCYFTLSIKYLRSGIANVSCKFDTRGATW